MSRDPAPDQPAVTLAQRLLHNPHPQGPTSVEMLIERLPDGISPELPPPSGATLIGSLVRWRHGRLLSLGEDWRGLLLVLAAFGPTERSLTLRLDKKEEPDGDDGHGYGNSFSITG
jgi:hypothetical protein